MMLNYIPFERRLKKPYFFWLLNAFIAISIICTAELGRMFGIKGLALSISVVWPPSGIALAALLLFGCKTWPGILLGILSYNIFHFYAVSNTFIAPVIAASSVSIGSLAEVLLGYYIIRRFSSRTFFYSVKDVFIFLIPVGIFACLIASSIGVLTLYQFGALPLEDTGFTWLTFLIGDSFGIYVFTPLIVVWASQSLETKVSNYPIESALMIGSVVLISYLAFAVNLPLLQLYIPIALWFTYRFRMHGATLATFVLSATAIVLTSLGLGPIIVFPESIQLMVLVTFLGTIVVTSLILAAVINERSAAWNVLQLHNIDLQETVELHTQEMKDIHYEIFIKEKLATLGKLALAVSQQIEHPLMRIESLTIECLNSLQELQESLVSQKKQLGEDAFQKFLSNISALEITFNHIAQNKAAAQRIMEIVRERSESSVPEKIKIMTVNLNTLLSMCLEQTLKETLVRYPNFNYAMVKEFDRTVMLPALSEDLTYAFINLIKNAIESMHEKKNLLGDAYHPTLTVRTVNQRHVIEITIRDNGMGVAEKRLENFFQSLVSTKPSTEAAGLSLALAYDIIVFVHHGQMKANSKEGEYLEIEITLPKPSKETVIT